ncbi:DsbA family protein [Nitratireductor pacificus]|uniref:DSBA oxidoreductase n=1 Tax=Nitratireductor pacificus pht-3B TaxID=391937 RepID=K2MJF8_9HYPH|nr:DsbA family protein [Nitratireductor pacificus]EKF17302.1 DSBA oxidoreductase [Nitratireductor pacificus pht-3B]
MRFPKPAGAALAASVLLMSSLTGVTQAADGVDKAAVEKVVREYLLANPEIMLEVQSALEKKQREQQEMAQRDVLDKASDAIFNSKHDGVIGNPEAAITVVEFFDYNCGYCKRALGDMQALVEDNPDVRFVLKEFPILSPQSREAHVVSAAVHAIAPEKYAEFHEALLGSDTRADGDVAVKIATGLGIDETALRAGMEDPQIQQVFAETYDLANQLAVSGTPAYVIGKEVVFGALGKDVLQEKIETARACLDKAC